MVLKDEDYLIETIVDKVRVFKDIEEYILKLGLEKAWEINR